jgi:CelD/BcsL family acetyltransferase involved in cellulose biosynthesis
VKIDIARSAAEMEDFASRWQSLFHNSSRKTLFQSYDWNLLAARIFADRESPYVISAESDSGRAIIPAALARDGTLVTFLGETLFDYRDVLAEGGPEPLIAAWRELEALEQQLWVQGIRDERPERWPAFEPQAFAEAPYVSAMNADEFATSHSRAARLLRKLEGKGVTLHQHSGSETSLLRAIYSNKARQLEGADNNLFADERRIDFMVTAAGLGSTEIFTIESDGAMIAGLVILRDGDVRRFYTIYYDLAWADWSPGTALTFEVTRQSLAEGLSCDYMTGRQNHKHRFATGSVRLLRVDASPEQLHAGVSRLATSLTMAA